MIGIVGFGRFGKLMTSYLAQDFDVLVYDPEDRHDDISITGAQYAPLEDVCRQDYIALPVPISCFRGLLKEIAPLIKNNAVVIDVCSVKEYPIQWMRELLPQHVSILATHPMFGPDSAAGTLAGCKIVLCRERLHAKRYEKIKSYLSSKELVVIESTPQEHDRQIAVSLALTHFIGRTLSEFGAVEQLIDTEGYKRLLHILEVVENDTWQLFLDMNQYNPYAEEKRSEFMQAMQQIEARLHP
jgi:prephenate dehydrogenase